MLINITDHERFFQAMEAMEGPKWKEGYADGMVGWKAAMELYQRHCTVMTCDLTMLELENGELSEEDWELQSSDKWSTSVVIYGDGGWHRYFVRGDGSVWFSKGHASSQKEINKAQELGFGIH